MNWYRISTCPKYAISEDGTQVKNIRTGIILNHNTAKFAPDGLRRVTLRHKAVYNNNVQSRPKVYTLVALKQFIKEENKL